MTASLPPRCGGSRSAPCQFTMISPISWRDALRSRPTESSTLGLQRRRVALACPGGSGRATRHPFGPALSNPGSAVALWAAPGAFDLRVESRSTRRCNRVHFWGAARGPRPAGPARRARVCCAAFVNRLCCCRWILPSQPPPIVDSAVDSADSMIFSVPRTGAPEPTNLRPARELGKI